MIQIRMGVFETNSSSTHSLVIVNNDDLRKFIKGKLYYNVGYCWDRKEHYNTTDKFITRKQYKKYEKIAKQRDDNWFPLYFRTFDELDSFEEVSTDVNGNITINLEYFFG